MYKKFSGTSFRPGCKVDTENNFSKYRALMILTDSDGKTLAKENISHLMAQHGIPLQAKSTGTKSAAQKDVVPKAGTASGGSPPAKRRKLAAAPKLEDSDDENAALKAVAADPYDYGPIDVPKKPSRKTADARSAVKEEVVAKKRSSAKAANPVAKQKRYYERSEDGCDGIDLQA